MSCGIPNNNAELWPQCSSHPREGCARRPFSRARCGGGTPSAGAHGPPQQRGAAWTAGSPRRGAMSRARASLRSRKTQAGAVPGHRPVLDTRRARGHMMTRRRLAGRGHTPGDARAAEAGGGGRDPQRSLRGERGPAPLDLGLPAPELEATDSCGFQPQCGVLCPQEAHTSDQRPRGWETAELGFQAGHLGGTGPGPIPPAVSPHLPHCRGVTQRQAPSPRPAAPQDRTQAPPEPKAPPALPQRKPHSGDKSTRNLLTLHSSQSTMRHTHGSGAPSPALGGPGRSGQPENTPKHQAGSAEGTWRGTGVVRGRRLLAGSPRPPVGRAVRTGWGGVYRAGGVPRATKRHQGRTTHIPKRG